jgi:hypothetical protein
MNTGGAAAYSNSVKNLFDYVDGWASPRYRADASPAMSGGGSMSLDALAALLGLAALVAVTRWRDLATLLSGRRPRI